MKCPKCGYNSFDHLDSCKKCSHDLVEHKEKFSLRGFLSPRQTAVTAATATAEPESFTDENDAEEESSADGSVDFGFDFLDEEDDPTDKAADDISLGDDSLDINIDQPFGVDSETIPADDPASGSNDKPEKGPEFAF